MSVKAELERLVDAAIDELHKIEKLAVSERNRVHEALAGAKGAVASMQVDEPEHAAVEAPAEPVAAPKPAEKPVED